MEEAKCTTEDDKKCHNSPQASSLVSQGEEFDHSERNQVRDNFVV